MNDNDDQSSPVTVEAAMQECVDIAMQYNDCGGDFIAQKIRDAILALPPAMQRQPDMRDRMTDADQVELLVNALTAIKRATFNGDVCPDVAWFDQIETLHDFCERVLDRVSSPSNPGE